MQTLWQNLRYGARTQLKRSGSFVLALIALASSLSLALILSCDAQPQGRNTSAIKIERFTVSNVEVNLHYFDQRLVPLDARIKAVVGQAFSEAVKLFGGLPKDLSGADYRRFQINLRYGSGEAECDPQLIEIEMNEEMERKPIFGYGTWQHALIHEMLHFWNAETFGYASGREQWFNEGVTEYYAFRLAIKLGLISKEDIPARLALPLGYYLNDSGIGALSLCEAGEGARKFQHYFLVYGGGLAAGLALDFDVRANSGNAKSLDDLMKALYRGFNRTDKLYTTAALQAELNRLTGRDYSEFFRRYIAGREVLPIGQYVSVSDLYFVNNPRRFEATSQKGRILKEMFYLDQK